MDIGMSIEVHVSPARGGMARGGSDEAERLVAGDGDPPVSDSTSGDAEQQPTSMRSSRQPNKAQEPYPTWMKLFLFCVFWSCTSFSIVLPSLAPYLARMGAEPLFLGYTIAAFCFGEMVRQHHSPHTRTPFALYAPSLLPGSLVAGGCAVFRPSLQHRQPP
jgi:hypothetical protein